MIRKMQPDDAPEIKEICELSLGHAAETEMIESRIKELLDDASYYIAVYVKENAIVGFIHAQKYDLLYGGKGWNIIALAVNPREQGKGIGKELLLSLEHYAKDSGASFIRLNSRADRETAHGFYEHLGYHCDKIQKRFIRSI